MSFGCFYDVPADEHIYGKVKAEIGEEQPKELLVQLVAKRAEGGLRHITVWESREAWERFQKERVAPAVATVLASFGMTEPPAPPRVQELDLIDVITKA
jgi:hypothetical protein